MPNEPSRLERIREIFELVQELSVAARSARLDELCADDADLRDEVEELLSQVTLTGLATAAPIGSMGPAGTAAHPERIGPYEILDVLGRGGMGVVYRAKQSTPVEREIALKVLPSTGWSEDAAARFELERQSVARMDHPGIAQLLDAGNADDGSPYFAMRLVNGEPITEYCRSRTLDVTARLDLFCQLCRAVQHAHQKAVLHRDLKPGNVLVTEDGDHPTVVVIDFGIAKSLEDSGARHTMLTGKGQILGTLEYMSPEQARGDTDAPDVRTDVYSLGILLFEMLFDRLPHDLRGLSLHEALQQVVNTDISMETTASGDRAVDRDLKAITLKCTEREPDRRYHSVAALLDDVERFARSEPILARPPSLAYQMHKLIRRHRFAFGFAATVLALLIGSSVVLSVMYRGQAAARTRAELQTLKADRVIEFLEGMLASADPANLGREVTVKEILDDAARQVGDRLGHEPAVLASMTETLARTYQGLGDFDASKAQFERAVALADADPDVPWQDRVDCYLEFAALLETRGEGDEALKRIRLARAIDVPPAGKELRAALCDASQVILNLGSRASLATDSMATHAVEFYRRAGTIRSDNGAKALRALAFAKRGVAPEDAVPVYQELAAIQLDLKGEDHPDHIATLNEMALAYETVGRWDDALAMKESVLEKSLRVYGPDHASCAMAYNNLGVHHIMTGDDLKRGQECGEQAAEIWSAVLPVGHPVLVTAKNNVGYLRYQQLDFPGAEEAFREAIAAAASPDENGVLSPPRTNLAWCLTQLGRPAEASAVAKRNHNAFPEGRYARAVHAYCDAEGGDTSVIEGLMELATEFLPDGGLPMMEILQNGRARWLARAGYSVQADSTLRETRDWVFRGRNGNETEALPWRFAAAQEAAELYTRWGVDEEADLYQGAMERMQALARGESP